MDVLSDVLRSVRLCGSVFFTADFSSPWALDSPNPELLATIVMPEADHVSLFHILMEGQCVVECERHPRVAMESGDVVVFPHGHAHTMRSEDSMQQLHPRERGWLAALRDPYVGKALRLLHESPMRPWTVDVLAHEVAISRSALAQRFTRLLGESPMKYLSEWRIHLAKQMLRDRGDNIQSHRRADRLRITVRIQPRVQEGHRLSAGPLAQGRRSRLVGALRPVSDVKKTDEVLRWLWRDGRRTSGHKKRASRASMLQTG